MNLARTWLPWVIVCDASSTVKSAETCNFDTTSNDDDKSTDVRSVMWANDTAEPAFLSVMYSNTRPNLSFNYKDNHGIMVKRRRVKLSNSVWIQDLVYLEGIRGDES